MKLYQVQLSYILFAFMIIGCRTNSSLKFVEDSNSSETYVLVNDWPKLPDHFILGSPTGLGLDTDGNIFAFHRSGRLWKTALILNKSFIKEKTISKIDSKTGEILESWGNDMFIMPHGLEVDSENNVWVTDCGLHQIFKFDSNGNLLFILGEARTHGSDTEHFNLPTDVAVARDGSFYVSDGYGNSRIIKFSKEGEYLFEWGVFGDKQGEFNTPHGLDLDKYGNVYVADRENNRIQKFDSEGNFITLWQNETTDQLYSVTIDNRNDHLFGIDYYIESDTIIKGSDIFRFDLDANLQMQFGRSGSYNGPVSRYHDILIDKKGDVYVGDILGNRIQKFRLIQD